MTDYKDDSWNIITESNSKDFGKDRSRTSEHSLEIAHVARVTARGNGDLDADASVDLFARCRWDGCVHLNVGTEASGLGDYVHICDLDDFIAQLQKVRDMARAHFGDNGHWKQS